MSTSPVICYRHEVLAILEHRQSQMRRIIKPQPQQHVSPGVNAVMLEFRSKKPSITDPPCTVFQTNSVKYLRDHLTRNVSVFSPYGQRGDRLWVRETWTQFAPKPDDLVPENAVIDYKADYTETQLAVTLDSDGDEMHRPRWRPSIHMPRWASRLTLEVTGVRVERLQDISEADAIAEGVEHDGDCWKSYIDGVGPFTTASISFKSLWDSINKDRAPWESNPWVWVVEFKQVETGRQI